MRIELGYGLITCQRPAGDPRSDRQLYAEALELAAEAERLGFASVWVSEHHFVDDAYMPSLLPMCAAIAARTERIRIGTGLLLAPLYEPIRLAEDAATVDLLSGGRFILGIGMGWRAEELEVLRVSPSERARRLEAAVATCRQAWAGGPVTGAPAVSYPSPYVTPLPAQAGGPPVWIGALAERAVRRAGRIGDGFMATEVTPESLAVQAGWAREGMAESGRDPASFTFSLHVPVHVHDGDADAAWAAIRPFHHYVAWKYEDMEGARGRPGPPLPPPALEPQADAALRAGIVLGTADEVAGEIARFAEAVGGALHFVARLYWPGMELERQREAMRRFALEVAPLLAHG